MKKPTTTLNDLYQRCMDYADKHRVQSDYWIKRAETETSLKQVTFCMRMSNCEMNLFNMYMRQARDILKLM